MTKNEINKKMDGFISKLLEDAGIDNWYYIAEGLSECANFIKNSPSTMMTEDYRKAAIKNIMNIKDKK